MCPSARCESGAILVGIVKKEGRVSYFNQKLIVDEQFVQIAKLGRTPEKRFRFANVCMKSNCRQWTGKACGIIESIINESSKLNTTTELPDCSIRSQCRWYKQCGAKACAECPFIITDVC